MIWQESTMKPLHEYLPSLKLTVCPSQNGACEMLRLPFWGKRPIFRWHSWVSGGYLLDSNATSIRTQHVDIRQAKPRRSHLGGVPARCEATLQGVSIRCRKMLFWGKRNILNQHLQRGGVLKPKGSFSGTPYHPFGTPWKVQEWFLKICVFFLFSTFVGGGGCATQMELMRCIWR